VYTVGARRRGGDLDQVGYDKHCADLAPILRDVIDAHRLPFLPRCAGKKRLRRGVHTSVRQLEADIRTFIDRHNENFKWAKSADQILASVKRFCQKTQQTLCREL
jgi:hypothetical protein